MAYSYEEWADITGLSVKQVRKALERIEALNLVKKYNSKHPFKGVLRALHIEVPNQLWALHHCLTSAGYKYEGDVLCSGVDYIELRLSVAGCSQKHIECHITMPNADNTLCATGADLSIYKKKSNENSVTAIDAVTSGENLKKEKQEQDSKEAKENYKESSSEEPEIHPSLLAIKTLPVLLMELHEHWIKYFLPKPLTDGVIGFNAHDAGKLWLQSIEKNYGPYAAKPISPKHYAHFKMLINEYGKDAVVKIIISACEKWLSFWECVHENKGINQFTKVPDIGLLYYYRNIAMNLFVVKLHGWKVYLE